MNKKQQSLRKEPLIKMELKFYLLKRKTEQLVPE
jgi:hypothetical protein